MSCTYTALSHQQLLKVEGKDAFTFLQGQLSCDLRDVVKEGSRLGSHCNIKGHMISLFRVMAKNDECFLLRSHSSLAEKALAQLKKYIIFSKATATLETEAKGIGFYGSDLLDILAKLLDVSADQLPTSPSHTLVTETGILCCIQPNRYEFWTTEEQQNILLAVLQNEAQQMSLEQWILEEIREGIADLREETSELFIPQMVNLQVFEGINFRKGCYTGQEIITRLQHRGILKRPMYRVKCSATEAPQIGQMIHCDEKEGVGQILLVAETEESGVYEMLAVIVKDRAEKDALWFADHVAIQVLDLPYTLDTRLFESKR
ncbi:MAG: folate-binding protein [Oceanospirillales bacterium]|nr:MAG: folate-binding protein [Oceanospirillales bacterium]